MPDEPSNDGRFASLYQATLQPLRRYLVRLLGNPAEAQDVAHDAYLRVYPKIAHDQSDHPEALLYTTARNLAFNRLKRRQISPISADTPMPEHAAATEPGVSEQIIAQQERQLLQEAVNQLPPKCRAVLLLRKGEMLSHKEIGARLNIAVSTVEKQYARALRLLRATLAEQIERSDVSTTAAKGANP